MKRLFRRIKHALSIGSLHRARRHRRPSFAPRVELLEDRTLLAGMTFTVDSAADINDSDVTAGNFELREAVLAANANPGTDSIQFDPLLNGQTITLLLGQLEITESLIVNGPGASNLTVDGGGSSRVIDITATASDVALDGLTISGGQTPTTGSAEDRSGGGIRSQANGLVEVSNSTISSNSAAVLGGGIYATTDFELTDSTVTGNDALAGGGIGHEAVFTILNSTVSSNTASVGGESIIAARCMWRTARSPTTLPPNRQVALT